jgi:chaperonin GroES
MNIRPLADRVLIKPMDTADELKGGIFIPDSAKEKPQEGEVVAIGTGKRDDKGELIAFNVKVGDKVLLPKYGGTEVKYGEEVYQIVREDDILAVID